MAAAVAPERDGGGHSKGQYQQPEREKHKVIAEQEFPGKPGVSLPSS
jgi:hypothetical protein